MGPPRCYIASPLGFSEPGRYYYREVYLPALSRVVEPVDPWALTSEEEIADAGRRAKARQFGLEIARRNSEAIRSCTLLAALLDGQEADSGTAAELGFAAGLGIRCFGLRSDLRESGEPGMSVNLQIEGFVVQSGGALVASLGELVHALAEAAGRER